MARMRVGLNKTSEITSKCYITAIAVLYLMGVPLIYVYPYVLFLK
jgi:hypothetical protein